MLSVLNAVLESVTSAIQFLIHIVTNLFKLFTAIPRFIAYLTSLVSIAVPVEIASFVLAAVFIYFILIIVDRN